MNAERASLEEPDACTVDWKSGRVISELSGNPLLEKLRAPAVNETVEGR
jgi:hypothetical protein